VSVTSLAQLGIRAISFDLDETLWPLHPVIVDAETAFYQWLQDHCPRLTARYSVEQLRERRIDVVRNRPELRSDVTRSRSEGLRLALIDCGYTGEECESAMQVFQHARNQVRPYEDVAPALADLSFHYRLASVTNGNADINATALGHYFDCTLAATLELPAKPAPDMFAQACRELGVRPEALLHIGDNPETDIDGAREFGCRTAWIRRGELSWPEGLQGPDIVLDDLHQLVALAPPLPGADR
jgi:putative hydrolase of the HAD superfamily